MTVVIELTVRMLREYPDDWDARMIDFHLNDSSHCLGNEIRELAESDKAEEGSCDTCNRAEAHFLRAATAEDVENFRRRVSSASGV